MMVSFARYNSNFMLSEIFVLAVEAQFIQSQNEMKGRMKPYFLSTDTEVQLLHLRNASKKGVRFTNCINSSSLKGKTYWTGPVKKFQHHKVCYPKMITRIHIGIHSPV